MELTPQSWTSLRGRRDVLNYRVSGICWGRSAGATIVVLVCVRENVCVCVCVRVTVRACASLSLSLSLCVIS